MNDHKLAFAEEHPLSHERQYVAHLIGSNRITYPSIAMECKVVTSLLYTGGQNAKGDYVLSIPSAWAAQPCCLCKIRPLACQITAM